jgi:hypothetical protein
MALALPLGAAQDCPLGPLEKLTDDFTFAASSDQGAVGDVVAIDITLTAHNPRQDLTSFDIVGCYDDSKAELLGDPQYSSFFDNARPAIATFRRLKKEGAAGFHLWVVAMNRDVMAKFFPSTTPFPVMTLYFRLKGVPGDSFNVSFCDKTFTLAGSCLWNVLSYFPRDDELHPPPVMHALSTQHVAGEVRILPGPATRTSPPAQPPTAKVYPEPPSEVTANIQFELTGAVAKPGAKEIPLDVFITSNYEFCGFSVSLKFPADYLSLARVEEHTRPGVVAIDNTVGIFGMYMANSARRVGAEGERVHIATLYFDVSEAAADVTEIIPTFESARAYTNWLNILWKDNPLSSAELPVNAQVSPLLVDGGILKIQRELGYRGDVNFDASVDLTDAIIILGDLFLGTQKILCPPAADFDQNGAVNLSDPISILNYLFAGSTESLTKDIDCKQ